MPAIITVTEASRRFSDVINRVFYRHESTVLLKGGKPVARIVPMERRAKTGRELATLWAAAASRESIEAEGLAHAVEEARRGLAWPRDPWA